MKEYTIGVLGGMGTYATIHFFKQYARIFRAEKEWERPRILIDNRCTMPSRVRAFLYNENVDKLVDEMTESMKLLQDAGCTRIVLACNTSHLFLPQIFAREPGLEDKVIHIVSSCVDRIAEDQQKKVFLLGSEGTIDAGIYQTLLREKGLECISPDKEDYAVLRICIEAVKQDKYTEETKALFLSLVNRFDACILGCTELPVLFEKYEDEVVCTKVYDPLQIVLERMKEEVAE